MNNKDLRIILGSIAGMIVLSQVAPVFYDAVGLKPGMGGDGYVTPTDAAYIQGRKDALGL